MSQVAVDSRTSSPARFSHSFIAISSSFSHPEYYRRNSRRDDLVALCLRASWTMPPLLSSPQAMPQPMGVVGMRFRGAWPGTPWPFLLYRTSTRMDVCLVCPVPVPASGAERVADQSIAVNQSINARPHGRTSAHARPASCRSSNLDCACHHVTSQPLGRERRHDSDGETTWDV